MASPGILEPASYEDFKQLLDEDFVISKNNQGRGKGCQPKPKAEPDNPYRDLDCSAESSNCFIIH